MVVSDFGPEPIRGAPGSSGVPESAAQAECYRVFDKRLNVPVVR